ncbi:MAG: glucose-6-phosphate dehydrogenase [Planctomycetia bacterium]|nr:glucose-6-phosphate dehydrogenase [Planctomycetia bacterium]
MSIPMTLIIFGASGDLTARKLVPSLYHLYRKKRLPDELQVLGVSRSPLSDDGFRDRLATSAREFVSNEWDETSWREFAQRLHYVAADASRPIAVEEKLRLLEDPADGRSPSASAIPGGNVSPTPSAGRRLYYLSVSPDLYAPVVDGLGTAGMTRSLGESWRRLIVEKPFGKDQSSAKAFNATLARHFEESQIYRIDHYLGKETVQNILVFRFANTLFEPLWNNNYVDHVQITVSEAVKVGSRGDYYDNSGVLRDMMQNHLLMLLTFIAMESPSRFEATALRNEKLKVLDSIAIRSLAEARDALRVGQYEGYHREKGVAPESRTPTYAALELSVENWRWRGVPFYLRTGKAMRRRMSEIVVQFRCPPHLMFKLPPDQELQCNRLSIRVQPDEGIHINFQSKVPDTPTTDLRPTDLEFSYKDAYPDHPIPEAYERLLLDALNGDASLFMRSDEIERAWAIVDPFVQVSTERSPESYPIGSDGPTGAEALLKRSGRGWLSLCR